MDSDITFILNNEIVQTSDHPAEVLLDFIRKKKKITGTKEVCKEGDCGACAVLLGTYEDSKLKYSVINSCLYPIIKVNGKHVVTIEGLIQEELSPMHQAFIDEGASQCGFCTPGFIISITAYLLNNTKFDIQEAINSVGGNICRCTGYHSIIRAIKKIGQSHSNFSKVSLIENKFIPKYFDNIPDQLKSLMIVNDPVNKILNNEFVSGGTDLFVQRPKKLLKKEINLLEKFVDKDLTLEDHHIYISGSVTVEELKSFLDEKGLNFNLDKLFNLFASLPIRNSATLAGNIVNASPIGDFSISLIALNASLSIKKLDGNNRFITLKNFYKGYKQFDKEPDEIIDTIKVPIPSPNHFFNFEKVSKRTYLDIASVNSALCVKVEEDIVEEAVISAGGVAPIPLFLGKASEYLIGKDISEENLINLIEIAHTEISPISDIRGSSEYKSLLLSQLIKAHFLELFPRQISYEVLK